MNANLSSITTRQVSLHSRFSKVCVSSLQCLKGLMREKNSDRFSIRNLGELLSGAGNNSLSVASYIPIASVWLLTCLFSLYFDLWLFTIHWSHTSIFAALKSRNGRFFLKSCSGKQMCCGWFSKFCFSRFFGDFLARLCFSMCTSNKTLIWF